LARSFTNPPVEIGDDQPVATQHSGGTPGDVAPGYALGPGEGPAIWFQGGIITMKARKLDTDGGFAVTEWFAVPGGFEHFFEELAESAQSATYPYTEHRQPPLEEIQAAGEKYGWSTGHGVLDTQSTAPPTVGRLERD
jgi:hypothetical protein